MSGNNNNNRPASSQSSNSSANRAPAKKTFTPKKNEMHLVHAELDKPAFNPATGKKINKAYVQIFNVKDFKNFERNASTLGFTVTVLWDPEKHDLSK